MKNIKFEVSGSLELSDVLKLVEDLYQLPNAEVYTFDFSKLGYVVPFAMIYFSFHINKFKLGHPGSIFKAEGFEKHGYLAHMGFFQSFNLDFGNKPGVAKGNSRYIPITEKKIAELKMEAFGAPIGERIDELSEELAVLLTQSPKGTLFETLTYSFREIIRNVVEHSKSDSLLFCGQYWPSQKRAEITIFDTGIGIRSGLSTNPRVASDSDEEALNFALLPGVSGKALEGSKGKDKGQWQNTGYGLYMTKSICGEAGSFFIISGNCGIYLKDKLKKSVSIEWPGTGIRMVIRTDRLNNFNESIKRFRDEGYKLEEDFFKEKREVPMSASVLASKELKKTLKK